MVPRPRNLAPTSMMVGVLCAVAFVVFPFDFREALVNTMIGTLMALSLVVLTGFVGQISVVQLTLAGVSGFAISHLAVNAGIGFPLAPIIGTAVAVLLGMVTAVSGLRVRGVSLAVVTLAAAVAIQNFGFLNPTWGGGQTGSPVPDADTARAWTWVTSAGFRGLDGNLPSPVYGWVVLVSDARALPAGRNSAARTSWAQRMLAVRSNERAAAAAAINPRNVKLAAFGMQRSDRRRGGVAVRIQLRLGQRGSVRCDHSPEPDRIRLRRRDHADLRSGICGVDLDPGAVPLCAGQVVRAERQLVSAVRGRGPDRHADPEPGRRRRRLLSQDAPTSGLRPTCWHRRRRGTRDLRRLPGHLRRRYVRLRLLPLRLLPLRYLTLRPLRLPHPSDSGRDRRRPPGGTPVLAVVGCRLPSAGSTLSARSISWSARASWSG